MYLKKLVIISLIILSLVVCISAVSAENSTANDVSDSTQDTVASDNTPAQTTTKTVKKNPKLRDSDIDVDDAVVVHKKKSYFKVKVEDDDKRVKNFKLKIKVYTKSKSKSYTIKTNSKGIAKFNTKVLKRGNHKVVITDADKVNKFKKIGYIFVGKKHTLTLKPDTSKKLKNKDVIRVYTKYDDDDKELKVGFKGKAKKTNIIKSIFYLKNKATGKIVKKVDYTDDFEHAKWQYPDIEYSNRFIAYKVKITYVTA